MSASFRPSLTRRRLLAAAGLAGPAGLLSGCSGSRSATIGPSGKAALPERLSKRQDVIIALDGSLMEAPFDPIEGWGHRGVNPFHSTLMVANEKNEIVNDLAVGHTISDDRLTWTFTLRDDATFTTGAKVTAHDVAFTYNKAKQVGKVEIPNFAEAVAISDRTVQLRLSAPSSFLPYTVATVGIVAKDGYGPAVATKPVGSGPWKLATYIQGQQVILERNDSYYGPKAKFAKVTILMMAVDAGLAAAHAGKVDITCVYPNLSQQQIPGFGLVSLPTFDYRTISMPCQQPGAWQVEGNPVGNAVTSDRDLRRALATALNRRQIVDQCLLGYGEVAFDAFDAFAWGIRKDTAGRKDGDVAKATEMLDQAGWRLGPDKIRAKGDLKASFTLHYPPSDAGRQAIAEGFKEQMRQIGIQVNLDAQDFTSMAKRHRANPIVLGGGELTPYAVYEQLSSANIRKKGWSNIACYVNERVEQHLTAALGSPDSQTATQHWHDALWDGQTGGSILGDSPYLMCCYTRNNYLVREGLSLGEQHVHPHDHFLHVIHNLHRWDVTGA